MALERGKVLVTGMVVVMIVVLIFQCDVAEGATYNITWGKYPDLITPFKTVYAGDIIEFVYNPLVFELGDDDNYIGYDTLNVNGYRYANCYSNRAKGLATGHDNYTLVKGYNYFIDRDTDLCQKPGMKLRVHAA